jgi:WD40 repeat protein
MSALDDSVDAVSAIVPGAVVAAAALGAAWLYRRQNVQQNVNTGVQAAGDTEPKQWTFEETQWRRTSHDAKREVGAVAWCPHPGAAGNGFRFVVGSYNANSHLNEIALVEQNREGKLVTVATANHRYRPSKIKFSSKNPDIFFTASDTIYSWSCSKSESTEDGRKCLKSAFQGDGDGSHPLAFPKQWVEQDQHIPAKGAPSKIPEVAWDRRLCAPIVSFDVNADDMLIAAHSQGRCLLWDVGAEKVLSNPQIGLPWKDTANYWKSEVANQRVIHDVSFAPSGDGRKMFAAACGADGVAICDPRDDSRFWKITGLAPKLFGGNACTKVRWNPNPQKNHELAVVAADNDVYIVDLRYESNIRQLSREGKTRVIRDIGWDNEPSEAICSVCDGGWAFVWNSKTEPVDRVLADGTRMPTIVPAYELERPNQLINSVSWGPKETRKQDWMTLACGDRLDVIPI